MKIYLAQHAEAIDKSADPARPISRDGAVTAARVAAHIARHDIGITAIRHSGKLRSKQTAEVYAEHLGVSDISEMSGMNPNDDVRAFISGLNLDSTLYVGHLPHLDKTLSCLIGGNRDQGVLIFKNSGIACIELGGAEPSLLWYLSPDIC
ncbi:MAG: phosphohistidine phosphatase SixA [Arenicellales bacterium]